MTRHTASSTALAVLFALGLTSPALAEIVLPADAAKQAAPDRIKEMRLLNRLLLQELDAGVNDGALRCLDGSARPCADDMPLVTPAGVAVQMVDDGSMILAPARMQPYRLDKDGMLVTRGNDFTRLANENLDRASAAVAALNRKPAEPIAVIADQDRPATAAPDILTAEIEAARNDKEKEQAAAKARAAADAAAAAAEASKQAEAGKQGELARMLASAKAASEAAAAPATPAKDSHAGHERRITEAEAAKFEAERAGAMTLLNNVLKREIRDGLTADGLDCIDGSKRPCADGVALVSPGGVTAEVTEQGRIVIGPMAQQQYIVNEDGTLRARGSNTAAAREAASAAAPLAEALTGGTGGEIRRETVAAADARSSAEDFETSLTEALAQATGTAVKNDNKDRDRSSDLAKVALAGLGALAVGDILSGQREVALNTGDRVIVTRTDGSQQVLKDDNALLRQAGSDVQTENYSDGSSRTVVSRPDGSQIITIRGSDLTVLRRIHVAANGAETVLIDDSVAVPPVKIAELPPAPQPQATPTTEAQLREALAREAAVGRRFTLNQIRSIPEVRNLVAPVDISAITFDTGSAAINPDQARQLASLGTVIEDAVARNPREIFLIEGHTDAVGSATYNLALSDRRAESVALALSEYFDVPPENLVVQGYGEEYLKIPVLSAERQNRRASVRRITDLLASAQ